MTKESSGDLFDEIRSRLFLQGLPDSFLRIGDPAEHHRDLPTFAFPIYVGHLRISIVEAKLAKNYGWISMHPYVRCRVGQNVFETTTATNGGLNPKWDRSVVCLLPKGVIKITVEIYDEKTFTSDVLVASTIINLPDNLFNGYCIDEWYLLSGKQGHEMEGKINIILSLQPLQSPTVPIASQSANIQLNQFEVENLDEKINELSNIYPDISNDIIKENLLVSHGNIEMAASNLADLSGSSLSANQLKCELIEYHLL
ncbi:hypothetical protein GJ496_000725 [Pomphorhynchus laevis]|nr:hypothetical protein GJ496_000725 [Pomphorhynchus laevis]